MTAFIARHLFIYSGLLVAAGAALHRYFIAWEPRTLAELDAWAGKLRNKILRRIGK